MKAPPIIALPGTLLDGRSLSDLLQGLDSRTEVLGTMANIDDEVDRLARLADDHAAVWLGHSLGGIVALHLAKRHPAKVAGLVLLAANARAGRDASEARRAAQWEVAHRDGLQALAHSKLAPGYGLAQSDAMLAALIEQAQAVGLARFEHQLAYARQRPGLLEPRWALNTPVLAVSGENDMLCPPEQSNEIVALARPPHCGVHARLTCAGHLFPMQQPREAAEHLRTFLHQLQTP